MKARIGTYLWKDKDPAIDYLRGPLKDSGQKGTAVARAAGVAPGTVYNMFGGKTTRPTFTTVVAVARAIGPDGERALMRCIKSGGRKR